MSLVLLIGKVINPWQPNEKYSAQGYISFNCVKLIIPHANHFRLRKTCYRLNFIIFFLKKNKTDKDNPVSPE